MTWQPEPHLVDAITRAGLPAPHAERVLWLGYTVAEIRAIEADRRRQSRELASQITRDES